MNDLSDLAGRYSVAVDTRDRPALAALFTVDAEFVRPPAVTRGRGAAITVGRDAIVAMVLDGTAHLHATHHAVHQRVIDVDGDSATGWGTASPTICTGAGTGCGTARSPSAIGMPTGVRAVVGGSPAGN